MPHDTSTPSPDASPQSQADRAAWIRDWMARELDLRGAAVADDRPFVAYGMDSIHAMMLVGDLEEMLGRRLTPTLTWDHPTVGALAAHLAPEAAAAAPVAAPVVAPADALPAPAAETAPA